VASAIREIRSTVAEACWAEDLEGVVLKLPVVVTVERKGGTLALLSAPVGFQGEGVWISPCVVEPAGGGYTLVSQTVSRMWARGDAVVTLDRILEIPDWGMTELVGQVEPNAAAVEVVLTDGIKATTAVGDGYFLAVWNTNAKVKEVHALDATGAALSGAVKDNTEEQ
jgi:hypothetical protein